MSILPDYAPRIERRLYRKAMLRDGLQALCALVVFILALSLVR